MTIDQAKKFIDAAVASEINYSFSDDVNTKYYNNETQILILDEEINALVSIRQAQRMGIAGNENIAVTMNDIDDIRRAEVVGDYESVKKFIDEYGLTLDNDQLKIMLRIDRNNIVVKPITGDYTTIYHKLSKAEYDALSPEEKAKYDANVKADHERFDLPKGVAARIDI